ncbi:MAG TPA: hypothetical protein VH143_35355 [Kofleriaceae bacterium]|jgi:hypothetical protein|nr:hypothetical protein [Kofleriaceae bacterium]
MAPADSSGAKPGPVALRIKLRYDDVDAMVQRFAGNVGRSGLFLPTRAMHPVGTEVKFELRIANDTPVLVGLGKVKAARPPDPDNPKAAFGLAIELMRVTRDGREIIIRMLERRRQLALPEVAIPLPEDVEAARRMDVDTQPGVPQPVPRQDSQPVIDSAPAKLETVTQVTAPVPEVTPTPAPAPIPMRPTPPPELLTSPRPAAGPVATARRTSRIVVAPVLAPERVRAKRPELADLVAKAAELSGPVAALDLDEPDVDIGKAIARARALAGGDLDSELDALREASAAPRVVDVEAASAELARQLGGVAIAKQDRSARWAPPPPVEVRAPRAVVPEPAVVETAPIPLTTSEIEIVDEAPRRLPTADPGELPEAAGADEHIVAAAAAYEPPSPVGLDVPTVIPGVVTPVPTTTQVDVEDSELLSFERALDAARVHTGVSAPAPAVSGDDEIPELDSGDLVDELPGEHTQIGAVSPYGEAVEEPPAPAGYAPFEHEHPSTAGADIPDDEVIDDVDVLAEADAYDDDLLAADGERDSSAFSAVAPDAEPAHDYDPMLTPPPVEPPHVAAFPRDEFVHDVFTPPPEPSPFRALSPRDDFAQRLALDEEDEAPAAPVSHYPNDPARANRLPQLHGNDDDDDLDEFDEPHNYTIAEDPDYENPEVEFDEQHGFGKRGYELADSDESDDASLDRALEQDPVEDLDNALSTLDVDLDRLSVPPEQRRVQARPLPGMPPARAGRVSDATTGRPQPKQTTQPLPRQAPRVRRPDSDDGVIIDFDDDDE